MLAAAALFSAVVGCQKESGADADTSAAKVYVEFTVNFDNGLTKADVNSGDVAVGTTEEHAVKYAYLYFFDATSGEFVKTVDIAAADITSAVQSDQIVKKTTIPTKLNPGSYTVYATLNYKAELDENATKAKFEALVYEHNYADFDLENNGIPMSSRDADGVLSQNVTVSASNTFDNPVPIQLYMERMLAKHSVKTSSASYTISDLATVTLTGYKMVNLTKNAYLFRHVGADASNTSFGSLTGSNYVIEPETGLKTDGTNLDQLTLYCGINGTDQYTAMPSVGVVSEAVYSTENTMLQAAEKMGYATAYSFSAAITPVAAKYHGENGAGYAKEGDLWYFGGDFYPTLAALNAAKDMSLSSKATDPNYYARFGVKYFQKGVCYYNYFIRHFDNNKSQELGVMEYAVVRNNDYQVTITGIDALGDDTPGADVTEDIELKASYFQATLLVRPWVVREQQAVLG